MSYEILGWILIVIVAVGYYSFGRWQGKRTRDFTLTSRPMTPEERRRFDAAFEHMGRAFDEINKI